MSRLSRRYRLLLGCTTACSVLSFTFALVLSTSAPAAVTRVHLPPPAMAPLAAPDLLDRLRADAALGDTDASGELARRLLDRFERTGDRDDLHEAMQWIARDWDQEPLLRSNVVNRVLSRHCDRPVLKWHWLCNGGD